MRIIISTTMLGGLRRLAVASVSVLAIAFTSIALGYLAPARARYDPQQFDDCTEQIPNHGFGYDITINPETYVYQCCVNAGGVFNAQFYNPNGWYPDKVCQAPQPTNAPPPPPPTRSLPLPPGAVNPPTVATQP